MSKIDKIIQILEFEGEIVGLSESGVMYTYCGGWTIPIKSPVVDNSACEVEASQKLNPWDAAVKEFLK